MASLPLIIEAQELASHLNDKNLVIVDLCNAERYRVGHIPGAIYVNPAELVLGTPPAPGKLPSVERLAALFSRLGLTDHSHFVAYDDEGGGWAGRFIWTLDVIGHKHYSYLNGGFWAWEQAGLKLTQTVPDPADSKVDIQLHPEPIATVEDILENLGNDDFLIWDARGTEEYRGLRQTAQKLGHIPGAVHCEWTELMDPQRQLRIREDAKNYLADKGIDQSKRIVTHCQTHHRSGFTYLVGKMLQLDIRAYPGSWSEWGNHPDTPVEQ